MQSLYRLVAASLLGSSLAAADEPNQGNFAARCAGSGVTLCVGFDAESDFAEEYLLPSFDGKQRITLDREIRASGTGAARFEIPPNSAASPSGGWVAYLGKRYRPGTSLHVQFRQRFSSEMLDTEFAPGGGWKQVILHGNASCASVELTTVNQYHQGFPTMYTDCGARNLQIDLAGGDVLLQQGEYECHYQGKRPASQCGYYAPNEWMTFYYEIELGEWDTPTSQIRAYMAYEGKPLRQFVDMRDYVLHYDSSPRDSYKRVLLTTYMTGKDMSQAHPTAYTWYDELIVSSEPIPPPAAE